MLRKETLSRPGNKDAKELSTKLYMCPYYLIVGFWGKLAVDVETAVILHPFSSPSPNSAMGLALVRTIVLCGF